MCNLVKLKMIEVSRIDILVVAQWLICAKLDRKGKKVMTKKQIQQACTACTEFQKNEISEHCPRHTKIKEKKSWILALRYKETSEAFEEMGGEYWQE